MKFFSRTSLKSLAAFGAVAVVVSSAYAASYANCQPICQQNAQNAYNQSYTYYVGQQTNYCNSIGDPAARNSCLAAVPTYAYQQATNVYNQAYNGCMQSCTSV
jgi:hypothetical protein